MRSWEGLEAAGVSQADIASITEINANARLEALQVAFALVGLVAIGALFVTTRIRRNRRAAPSKRGPTRNPVHRHRSRAA